MLTISEIKSHLLWLTEGSELLTGPDFFALTHDFLPDPEGFRAKIEGIAQDHPKMKVILGRRYSRLGNYYEDLADLLFSTMGYEVLERNIPILEGKRTAGEVDLIIEKGGLVHALEIALKFYLWAPDSNEFIGPNGRDRFEAKIAKVQGKQIPLAKEYAVGKYSDVRAGAWITGRLYYPHGDGSVPEHISLTEDAEKGIWWRENEIIDLRLEGSFQISKDRFDWIHGDQYAETLDLMEFTEYIAGHFSLSQYPIEGIWYRKGSEPLHFFVVHSSWPSS